MAIHPKVGTQLEITENWQVRLEVGFIKRKQVIAGLNYRFGWAKKAKEPAPQAASKQPAPQAP